MSSPVMVCGVLLGLVLASPGACGQSLTNAGFEAGGLSGWTVFGPGWRTSSFSNDLGCDAHSGELGLVTDIKKNDKDEWRGVFQVLPAERGSLYTGSVWIRAIKARSAEAMLEFQFLNKDNEVLGIEQSMTVSGSEPYTRVEINGVQPPKHTEWISVRGVVYSRPSPARMISSYSSTTSRCPMTNKNSKGKSGGGRSTTTLEERIAKRAADRASGL